eukprot:GFUD01016590.1.p1 GENE.GFUD01016590.1~~GFUD01016590.1.p1  ORF type:complete len:100 (+),score=22.97 GFUD01016590.1:197-496(+)
MTGNTLNSHWIRNQRGDTEVDTEDADEEDTDEVEMKIKRWRPDRVYEAINEFVKKMWGEKDANENIKEENDPLNDWIRLEHFRHLLVKSAKCTIFGALK